MILLSMMAERSQQKTADKAGFGNGCHDGEHRHQRH